jgi:hypothetical protein
VGGRVETKVTASTGAAAVSGLVLWALGTYVFRGGVPDVIVSWTYVLVPSALTFAAGYHARHTPRPAAVPHRPPKTLIPPPAAPPE